MSTPRPASCWRTASKADRPIEVGPNRERDALAEAGENLSWIGLMPRVAQNRPVPTSEVSPILSDPSGRYDAWTLKRFAEPKRHAMLACFLTEAQKTVLDHLAEMHDRLLTRIWGRSQRAYEERHRELRRRAKEDLDQLVAAWKRRWRKLCRQVNEEELQAALASCRAFQHLERSSNRVIFERCSPKRRAASAAQLKSRKLFANIGCSAQIECER